MFALLFGSDGLGVPRDAAYAWWTALQRASWTEAAALRGIFALYKDEPGSFDHWVTLFREQLAPQRLIQITEALIQEGLLARPVAVVVEDIILKNVTNEGRWAFETSWLQWTGHFQVLRV